MKYNLLNALSISAVSLMLANCGSSNSDPASTSEPTSEPNPVIAAQEEVLRRQSEQVDIVQQEAIAAASNLQKKTDERKKTEAAAAAAAASGKEAEAARLRQLAEQQRAEEARLRAESEARDRRVAEETARLEAEALETEAAIQVQREAKQKADIQKFKPATELRQIITVATGSVTGEAADLAALDAILTDYFSSPETIPENIPEILAKAKEPLKRLKITQPQITISANPATDVIPIDELERRKNMFSDRKEEDYPELRRMLEEIAPELAPSYSNWLEADWISVLPKVPPHIREKIIYREYEAEQARKQQGDVSYSEAQKLRLLEILIRRKQQAIMDGTPEKAELTPTDLNTLDEKSALKLGIVRSFGRTITLKEKSIIESLVRLLSPQEARNILSSSSTREDIERVYEAWKVKIQKKSDRFMASVMKGRFTADEREEYKTLDETRVAALAAQKAALEEEGVEQFSALSDDKKRAIIALFPQAKQTRYMALLERIPSTLSFEQLRIEGDAAVVDLLEKAKANIEQDGVLFSDEVALHYTGPRIKDHSSTVSFREARTSLTGSVDARGFKDGGYASLNAPVFLQLNGNFTSGKTTEHLTGAAAYRIGNTVVGAIQAYANTGTGFGLDASQLETSVVASHSFNNFFVEGQFGAVSATNVHEHNWSGNRTQLTVGYDAEFVTPFVQLLHRNLSNESTSANDTFGFVGVDVALANVNGFTSSLLAKAGVANQATSHFAGSVEWASTLNLTSGVSFGTNLSFNSTTDALAAFNFSVEY